MDKTDAVLVVGEVVVDFTLASRDSPSKLRLGGVAHAARGLWAAELDYSVAAYCPQYLVDEAKRYLAGHGCKEFIWLGEVVGAPNVFVIGDPREVSHQGYEDLLRDSKRVQLRSDVPSLERDKRVLVYPGKFELCELLTRCSPDARFAFDIAYDVRDLSSLQAFRGRADLLIISTSSPLFEAVGKDNVGQLLVAVDEMEPEAFLLKENRGGSRLFLRDGTVEEIPASLGETVNSVGVGDVYSAVMFGGLDGGWAEAAWRGCQAATCYSLTTYPDDLRRDVQRAFKVPVETLKALGGTFLPWHDRPRFSIYIAGPDFSYVSKAELDRAIASLQYHNFRVRRPIKENGELTVPASRADLHRTYHYDYQLLRECHAIFAVPLGRDPGALVEIGMAIALGKPVITFDPRRENENTMVLAGSSVYSADLDACLNGLFDMIARLRAESK